MQKRTNRENSKLNFISIKNVYSSKMVRKVKPQISRKYLQIISYKGLISKTYRHPKLNN